MPQKINLNVNPYNDDYDFSKGYYRVLFRPGYSIQSRELNTLQSILQNQIENIGRSQYKQGQQVVPGEVSLNTNLNYVKLSSVSEEATNVGGDIVFQKYDISKLIGFTLQGLSSGVTATVISFAYSTETESDVLFVKYTNSGNSGEEFTFRQGETLEVIDIENTPLLVVGTDGNILPATIDVIDYNTGEIANLDSPAMGFASAVKVEAGVYFINGYFVNNTEQLIVVDKYYNKPSVKVGFSITEEIISADEDSSLFDNARGFSNYSAPGANRLKIDLSLIVYPYDANTSSDYVQLLTVKNGDIQKLIKKEEINAVEEILARRTYDESGNYILENFSIDLREYYLKNNNQGTYPLNTETNTVNGLKPVDAEKLMIASVGSGKAYVKGYEIINNDSKYLTIDKARDTLSKPGNRLKVPGLSSFNITNVYNSIPLNADGEDLTAYPDLYLSSVFNDGFIGFRNVDEKYNRRGQKFQLSDGVITVYVKLNGENPTYPAETDLGKKLWFIIERGTSLANVISKSATIIGYELVQRPDIDSSETVYIEYTLLGNKEDLLFLKNYDETSDTKVRYIFKSNSADPNQDNGQTLANSYYYVENQPVPYADVIDNNEIITPIIGVSKPKNFQLTEKGSGFNRDVDIILSRGRVSSGDSVYNSIFNLSYFNPIFFTKLILDSNLDTDTFLPGKYVYGLISNAYGVVEGSNTGNYSFGNTLFIRTISGQFVGGESIVDEDGNAKKIAKDNTISHFNVLKRGSGYVTLATGENSEVSKLLINGVTYETTAIRLSTLASSIYKIDIVNRDLVSEIYKSTPAVSVTIGSGAIVTPILFKNTVTTYSPQNVKSTFCTFGSEVKNYVFTSDVESFNSSYIESKILTDFTFSGVAGYKFIECNGFSGDPSTDLIQGDIVQFVYNDNTVERSIVQYVIPPSGLSKSRIYLNAVLKKDVNNINVIRIRPLVENSTNASLIVPTGSKYLKSIVDSVEDSKITYYIRRDFVTKLSSNGNNITFAAQLPYGTQRFVSFSEKYFLITVLDPDNANNPNTTVKIGDIIYLTNEQVTITNSTETSTGLTAGSVTINLPSNFFGEIDSFENFKIKLTASIEVSKPKPKLKTLVSNKRIVITSSSDRVIPFRGVGYEENSSEVLSYSDAFKLKYVYEGSPSVAPVVNSDGKLISGIDVTDRYTFDNGQRDTFYDVSRIILKPGLEPPTGQLVIGFDYFEHSQGDFCTIDSYVHEAGVNVSDIPEFNSAVYGKISLRDVFDYRPKVDTTTIISGYEDSTILNNPVSFTKSGGSISNTIAIDDNLEFNLLFNSQQYLDRIDGLFLNKDGTFTIERGTSSLNPNRPLASEDALPLYYFYIPAYTNGVNDVNILPVDNKRYTMKDIGKIEKRIERLEQYTTLSILEQQALNMQIKDEVGLDRFKTGFVVDNFETHSIGNLASLDYKCAIDPQQSVLRPRSYESDISLKEINTRNVERLENNYVNNNNIITLPYVNLILAQNNFATKKININQFSVSQYVGDVKLNNPVSKTYNKNVFPIILNNDSKLFSVFYAKNNTRDGVESIYNNYIVNWVGNDRVFFNSQPLDQSLINNFSTTLSATVSSTSNISPQNNELAKGITTSKSGFNNVVSSIQYFCDSNVVKFTLTRLKPKTKFYAFLDNKNIDKWIVSDFRYTGIPGNSLSTFGGGITTDDNGNASGYLIIPAGYPPVSGSTFTENVENILYDTNESELYFITGNKNLKFTSDSVGSISSNVESYAQTYYYVVGSNPINPSNIISTVPANIKTEEGIQLFNGSKVKPNPLIQTFKVENYPGGVFVTALDLFFSKKVNTSDISSIKKNLPVRVYLTNVENGKPGRHVIPGTEVSKVSDTYIRVYTNGSVKILKDEILTGVSSGCSGPIKEILDKNNIPLITSVNKEYLLSEDQIYTIVLSNYNGKTFKQNEEVRTNTLILDNARQSTALRITISRDSGKVTGLELKSTGSGYENASITMESPQLIGGINSTANIYVSDGIVFDADISIPGSGYTDPPAVIINGIGNSASGAEIVSTITIDTPAVIMGVASDTVAEVSTIPTTFTFDHPIYLQNDTEYAFAVESDSSDYEIWASKLGENEIITNSAVSSQPLLGSLYKSQNSENWSEDIFEDIKFTIHRAEFDISRTALVKLTNNQLGYEKLQNNPIETYSLSDSTSTSKLFKNSNKIIKINHNNNGFEDGGVSYVAFKKINNISGLESNEINSQLFKIIDSGIQYYTIELPKEVSSTEITGGDNVVSLHNKRYEKIFTQIDYISAPETFVESYVRTTNIRSVDDDSDLVSYTQSSTREKVFLNQEYYFNNQKVICSRINEIKNLPTVEDNRSFVYEMELSSNKSYLSPLIDLRTANTKIVTNIIEKSSGFETRYGRTDQILKLYSIFKLKYAGTGLTGVSASDIVGSPTNTKVISGYTSKAKGIVLKFDNTTNSIWVKMLTDTVFKSNETLIFDNIPALSTFPTSVTVANNGVDEILLNFNIGDTVVCCDKSSSNLNKKYDNVISGKVIRWDARNKELILSNNKNPINNDYYSPSSSPSFARIPFSITETTGTSQLPDIFRVGDILSYPNIATADRAFAEIKSLSYTTGILYTAENASKNSSSVAKYSTKEIFVTTPSTSLDVRLKANIFKEDDIIVLYKIKSASSQYNFDDLEWNYFNETGLSDISVTPSPENIISGYLEKQSSYKEYKYSVSQLPEFSSYAIKIVMRSSNAVFVPKIQDCRIVASF